MKTFKQFKAVEHARKGYSYDNPYDQPGEEEIHNEYRRGYDDVRNK